MTFFSTINQLMGKSRGNSRTRLAKSTSRVQHDEHEFDYRELPLADYVRKSEAYILRYLNLLQSTINRYI